MNQLTSTQYDSSIYAKPLLGDVEDLPPKGVVPDREILERLYEGLDVDLTVLYSTPINDHALARYYLPSKIWRLNNLYTIIDKDGERIPFVMNMSQHKAYAAGLTWYRVLILKSRQQGISTFWLLCFKDDSIFYPDLEVGLMSQGKKESAKLLKRVKLAWRSLSPTLKTMLKNLKIDTSNNEEIGFSNNSTIFIQVSFRSGTLQRLHVSELGKIANNTPERARELKTGTLQTIKVGMPIIIESTADGENMFKDMWEQAISLKTYKGKDFMPLFLSWMEDPDCNSYIPEEIDEPTADYFKEIEKVYGGELKDSQKWFWVMQKRELQNDIYQEYPSTATEAFISVRDGTYYARLYMEHITTQHRVVAGLYDPTLTVQVALDLGMDDTFVLVYSQSVASEVRIIDEYCCNGKGVEHYVNHMFNTGYVIDKVELPHDSNVRELCIGKSRKAYMRDLGVTNMHREDTYPGARADGIDMVRRMIPNMWIDEKCKYIQKCLKSYTKEWDKHNEVWKDTPKHDEASNGADTIRVLAMGLRTRSTRTDIAPRISKRPRDAMY